ncbi:recombination directionality factor [Polaromonas aquatica]|uniref:Uncharacterized protein n=1 Tax=Polaromonas aquatica TaxID=332657 RepID=A0ABW1TU78_9BURK
MNLGTIPVRPFAEGIIRIATTSEPGAENIVFDGSIEILSRHHQARQEEVIQVPRMEKHPIREKLMDEKPNKEAGKLVEVPIRMFFGKTSNALTVAYQAYDADGRPVCRGNGELAKRTSLSNENVRVVVDAPCAGPETCEFVASGNARCRRQVCMSVQIPGQENPLSTFEVRSSSYNTYKTLKGQLELVERRFGGLRHVPLKLQIWQTSNQASDFDSFDVFKIALGAPTELEAMKVAKLARTEETEAGLDADVDSAYTAATVGVGEDDFEIVTDFYTERPSAATRRNGGTSFVDQLTAVKGQGSGTSLAENVIAQAMARAGEGAGQEKAQYPGSSTQA